MKNQTKKKILNWFFQGLLFIGIFVAISWWQQKDMLSTNAGEFAPSFSLVSMAGEVHQFLPESTAVKKKTLIYFFAPWCSVCHASIDNIQSIHNSSSENIDFFAVALDWKTKQEVEQFLAEHQLNIPVLLGTKQTLQDFKIKGFPSYYVVDKDGILQSKDFGYTTELGMRVRLGLASL
ncbi:MAG: redoxin domain-containing protein [Kangiellaceae bacterium]|nr:redoxin domain-containing protein [Kangiellaceae bacterium]